jgi:hypothetical protein
MELFIPSLVVLVIAAVIVFLLLPNLSPYILGILAISFLVAGVYQHYSMFPYEYRTSMISEALKQYSGFIMIGAMIFGLLVVLLWSFGLAPPAIANVIPAMPSLPAMPAMPTIPGLNAPLNGSNRPANNKGGLLGMIAPTNNTKRNNLASTSFKTV